MTRRETVDLMMKKADELVVNWSYDKEREIWNMAYDWNSEHYGYVGLDDGEIFMCEKFNDDETELIGFCIEDDYWLYQN